MEPAKEEYSESEGETLREELENMGPKPITELQKAIHEVYNNVNAAQQIKGVFSMQECSAVIKSKDNLLKFFEDGNTSFATEKINEDFIIFVRGVEKQQTTGVFSMEGSVTLLDRLNTIENAIEKRKSPSDAIKELREKKVVQQQKQQNNQNPQGQGRGRNRKRGGGGP